MQFSHDVYPIWSEIFHPENEMNIDLYSYIECSMATPLSFYTFKNALM